MGLGLRRRQQPAIGANVDHAWSAAGTSTRSVLEVTDDDGLTDEATHEISVEEQPMNLPPVAHAGFAQVVEAGATVTLDGSQSMDADGSIVSWAWDFGDGQNGSGETTSHIYGTGGVFTAELTVTDDDGATDTDTVTITVEANLSPNAVIAGGNRTVEAGVSVPFDGTGSNDPDGSVVSYLWDFGDGEMATGAAHRATCSPRASTPWSSRLPTTTETQDSPPCRSPPSGPTRRPSRPSRSARTPETVGQFVTLNGSGSSDPDGDAIVGYLWDFGDVSANQTGPIRQPRLLLGGLVHRDPDRDGRPRGDERSTTATAVIEAARWRLRRRLPCPAIRLRDSQRRAPAMTG